RAKVVYAQSSFFSHGPGTLDAAASVGARVENRRFPARFLSDFAGRLYPRQCSGVVEHFYADALLFRVLAVRQRRRTVVRRQSGWHRRAVQSGCLFWDFAAAGFGGRHVSALSSFYYGALDAVGRGRDARQRALVGPAAPLSAHE